MLKKNTRKRLLAGALATVMMLTMCPSWALADNLADDEGIATLPANEEIAVPVDDSAPVEADTTKTPAVPTPSEPEAKPAEDQNTAPAPSNGGANGGTDSTESGNSTNPTIPEGSGNISQKNDVVSNPPANTTSLQEPLIDLTWPWQLKKDKIKYFVLLPNRERPQNGASQGPDNYLPSSLSDGGVAGCNNETGYIGGDLTQDGKDKADEHRTGDELTNGYTKIDDVGFGNEYLVLPKDLGFFNPDKWDEYGNYNGTGDPATSLGTDFNGKDIKIVWYTIKHLADGYHIDGYVKNVKVTVTYHSNFPEDKIYTHDTKTGTNYEALSYEDTHLPDRANYKFVGWCNDQGCTDPYTKATLQTSMDLYAKWEPNTHEVTWKIDDTTLATDKVAHGEKPKQNPKASKPSEAQYDYTFRGWKRENGDGKLVNPTDIPVTENVTYVAVFDKTERNYTVTWKNGETTLGTEPVAYGKMPTKTFTPEKPSTPEFDYKFLGWKVKDGNGELVNPNKREVTADVTYIAVFEEITRQYTVTYYINGTEQYETTKKYAVGTTVTVESTPALTGRTFTGWISNDVTLDGASFTMPAKDVTIQGFLTQNKRDYTINKHFYDEKGTEVKVNSETKTGNEYALISELYKKDAVNQTVDGKNYVYVSGLTKVTDNLETLTKDVTIDLHYYLNVEGGNDIPDAWEYRLTFKVVNGEWNDGGNADKVVYVQFKDEKTGKPFKDEAVVVPVTRIPPVGEKPNSGYHAGAWDTSPYDNYKVQKDTVFTYTYAKNSSGGSSGGSGGHHRKPTVTIPDEVPTGLNGNDHYAYIVGYPDKTVRPQNGIARAEVATIFFRLLTDETRNANSTKSNSYSDVAAGAWYNHAVSTLSAMGIVKGDSNGKFNPNAPITRAEFAAIAARFDDKANSTTADFSDIVSHWAKNEISAASNNGWINGYPDGTFRPDNKITRAEAMTLVNRVLKRLPETAEDLHDDMIKWSDNSDASQWFYLAVQEATNSHYYKAKENKFEKWTELRDTRDWTELEK